MNERCLKITKHADDTVSVRMTLSDAKHVFDAFKTNAESWSLHKWAGFDSENVPGRDTDSEVMKRIEVECVAYAKRVLDVVDEMETKRFGPRVGAS